MPMHLFTELPIIPAKNVKPFQTPTSTKAWSSGICQTPRLMMAPIANVDILGIFQIFLVKNGKCKAVYVTFARFRECLRLLSEPSLIWESGRCQMTRLLLTWVFGTALRFWLE